MVEAAGAPKESVEGVEVDEDAPNENEEEAGLGISSFFVSIEGGCPKNEGVATSFFGSVEFVEPNEKPPVEGAAGVSTFFSIEGADLKENPKDLGSSFFAASTGVGAEPKENEVDGVEAAGGAVGVEVEGGAPNENPLVDLGGSCFFSVAPKEKEEDDAEGAGGGGAVEGVEPKEKEGFDVSSFFSVAVVEGPKESEGRFAGFDASTFFSFVAGAEPKLNEDVGFAASTGFEAVVDGAAPKEKPPDAFAGSDAGTFAASTT